MYPLLIAYIRIEKRNMTSRQTINLSFTVRLEADLCLQYLEVGVVWLLQ